ncbi:MAG TPA: hypothetical protein VN842_04995 [Thermoplasmata archaeon]|nr:hypothetical protein [Thermoplasmata archaeon]
MGSSLPGPSAEPTPEEEVDFRERLEQVIAEKGRALADPGPPWKEWFLHDGAKWWVGLGFLIVDVWFIVGGIEAGLIAVGLGLLLPVTYLQFIGWRYLWYRPPLDRPVRGDFRRSWVRPVEFGRWTPEGVIVRTQGRAALGPSGPNPKEFI